MELNLASWTMADTVLVGLAVIGVFLAAAPAVASSLGLSIIRYVPLEDPAEAEPDGADSAFDQVYEELLAAGFTPTGAIREETWLFQHHWYKAFFVRVLNSPDGNTFAAVYRLVPGEPWRVSLESFTGDGAMIRTVMPGAGLEERIQCFSRREVGPCELDEHLAQHAEHVACFVEVFGGVVAPVSLAERTAIDERLERQQVQAIGGSHNFVWLGLGLAFPAFLASKLLDRCLPDLTAPAYFGASIVLGSIAYLFVAWFVLPWLIAVSAAQENPA